jgi:branched-chain amino acid transport system substrate-binding protein
MLRAIDLAIKERGGKVSGVPIEHLVLDGGSGENGEWSPRIETDNVARAASDPQVMGYIGPFTSGATGVGLSISNPAHLLTLGPTATWPGLTLDGWDANEPGKYNPTRERNYARLALPDSRQGEAAARWASSLGLKRAYVLDDGSTYNLGLASRFAEAAGESGMIIVGTSSLLQESPAKLASQIKSSGADALFFAPSSVDNVVKLASLLDDAQVNLQVFVSDTALSDKFLDAVGAKAATWHFIYNGGQPTGAVWSDFASKFEAAYGTRPTTWAARAYDLTNLVLDALTASPGASRAELTRQVLATRDYEGASGLISFDERGDSIVSRMEGYRVDGRRFVLDRTIEW